MDVSIKDAVNQWIRKAKEDWDTIVILIDHPRCPRNTVCFHCQQYVEKLLKALLTLHKVEFPRTHSLRRLTQLCEIVIPELHDFIDTADELTYYSVQSRYPDDWCEVSKDEMTEMIEVTKEFQKLLLPALNLK